jgi:hypothetical protein
VNQDRPTGEKEINAMLKARGFAPMQVPGGMSPLVAFIGTATPANIDGQKVKDRAFKSPLLVRFVYPSGWLLETPNIDENGEAGNIGANNYVKGDAANFAALELPPGENLSSLNKEFYKRWLSSQMTTDVFEDVKVKKVKPVTQADGAELAIIDFTYTLITRAGFTVIRKGIAGATVADNALVGIVTATTEQRYKELSEKLQFTADSFRAYPVKNPDFSTNANTMKM